jgi:hypothetical protein
MEPIRDATAGEEQQPQFGSPATSPVIGLLVGTSVGLLLAGVTFLARRALMAWGGLGTFGRSTRRSEYWTEQFP